MDNIQKKKERRTCPECGSKKLKTHVKDEETHLECESCHFWVCF